MDSLSAFDDLYTAIEACLIYPDEVIDRLARAFYPAILACWNSEEGQREFAAWQAEQVHLAGKEKQEVPAGELPAVHIILVCGFWQGTSGWAHPVFLFLIPQRMEATSMVVVQTENQNLQNINDGTVKVLRDFCETHIAGHFSIHTAPLSQCRCRPSSRGQPSEEHCSRPDNTGSGTGRRW